MTYVLSDIHGDKRRLTAILEQIDLKPHDRLYVIGDVIDRKPDGIEILDTLLGMENVTLLLGNHELMMLNALSGGADLSGPFPRFADEEAWELWEYNGGLVTLTKLMRKPKAEIDNLLQTLNDLPLTVEITVNDRVFLLVHGAPLTQEIRTGYSPRKEKSLVTWGRVTPETELYENKTVIFGHTPTVYYQGDQRLSIWHGKNRIGIDCGCAFDKIEDGSRTFYGRLGCLRLDDMKEFYAE